MGKTAKILWLFVVVIGLGLMFTLSNALQDDRDQGKLRFNAESRHAVTQIEACLFEGKGGEVFGRLQAVAIRLGNQTNDRTYSDGSETRLVLVGSDGGTRITFRSTVPATSEELDVLDW